MDPQLELDSILIALRGASLEEQAEIGRGDLASLLHVASPQLVDKIIKMARRDNRVRCALAASRYYCGLGKTICDKIDSVVSAPFPAALQPKRKPSSRR
ncbi:hypothetical protein JQ597_17940 [Bradyrhizobium sp. AUGA SZCCT0177]|uniref:hypothetical protein n=1 Tax=Bradyrhizobium sp. AUGA SZCCT0177 TaxID=2807665 RepID=UPI001BA5E008|nr:hypothetical protein [Bradyrhizobium sp. AUGA SZCCT0177]MBR1283932.1 hypothetical protein [Bradyrhizobium sp. AUGA SZCCT0177]